MKRSELWELVKTCAYALGVEIQVLEPDRPEVAVPDARKTVAVHYKVGDSQVWKIARIPAWSNSDAHWDWPANWFHGSTGGNRAALTAAFRLWCHPPYYMDGDTMVHPIEDD